MRPGARITLGDLLGVLGPVETLAWGTAPGQPRGTAYEGFRRLNRHIELPVAASVAPSTDLVFTASTDGGDVRFFLPIGAADALRRAGVASVVVERRLDAGALGRQEGPVTFYDREYDELVRSASTLAGFTLENRDRLDALVDQFDALAAQNPTAYRRSQREIARIHRSVWHTKAFEELASAVALVGGSVRFAPVPTTPMEPVVPVPPVAPAPAPVPLVLPNSGR